MHLASNLKYLRNCKGDTQREIADHLQMSAMAVSHYENGDTEPDLEALIMLADYFGVSVDDLLRKDLRPPKPMYAKNLKFFRERYEMSQEEMSRLLGLKDKSSCCLIEKGKSKLSVEQLMKLSEYFGVTLDQFVKQDLSEVDYEKEK